jgi:hypothetical protein
MLVWDTIVEVYVVISALWTWDGLWRINAGFEDLPLRLL